MVPLSTPQRRSPELHPRVNYIKIKFMGYLFLKLFIDTSRENENTFESRNNNNQKTNSLGPAILLNTSLQMIFRQTNLQNTSLQMIFGQTNLQNTSLKNNVLHLSRFLQTHLTGNQPIEQQLLSSELLSKVNYVKILFMESLFLKLHHTTLV